MTKHLLLLLFFLSAVSCSSPKATVRDSKLMGILPVENDKVVYRQKFAAPGVPKAEIFRRARRWWVQYYRSAKDVMQVSDESTGELVGRGISPFTAPARKKETPINVHVYSLMALDAKDNEYTIVVSQIKLSPNLTTFGTPVEEYRRSPERSLVRVMEGLDLSTKSIFADINKAVIEGM